MADCLPIPVIEDFVSKDTNRISGTIAKALIQKSPYINVLKGGVWDYVSEVQRAVVQEPAAIASSLTEPVFFQDVTMCLNPGVSDELGTTEYTYMPGVLRGKGPNICVNTAPYAFKDSYKMGLDALRKAILQITNVDVRANLARRCGLKFTMNSTQTFTQNLSGDYAAIDTTFLGGLPDSPISFKALQKIAMHMKETLLVEQFETSNMGTMFKWIGGIDSAEGFRNELEIRNDIRYMAAGSFKWGAESLTGYEFEGPYRGIAFGIDPQPLRFNALDVNNYPIFIEPLVTVNTSKGKGRRPNPLWLSATYELSLLMGMNSFQRDVPRKYSGEGEMKFDPLGYGGELKWHYAIDNDCNLFGDYGRFIYEMRRAYKPLYPHACCAIIHQRCSDDLGLTPCVP